jgi:hypothetical protein
MYNKNSRHTCYHEVAHRLRTAASVKFKLQNKTSFIFKRAKCPPKITAHTSFKINVPQTKKTRPPPQEDQQRPPRGLAPQFFLGTSVLKSPLLYLLEEL